MLKTWLQENDTTNAAFAARIGVSAGFLSMLASGVKKPSLLVAVKIWSATGGAVPPWGFFSQDELNELMGKDAGPCVDAEAAKGGM